MYSYLIPACSQITRSKRYPDYGHSGSLKIRSVFRVSRLPKKKNLPTILTILGSVVARNNEILKKLVLEAKRDYEKDAEHRVHIFMADTWVHILRVYIPVY